VTLMHEWGVPLAVLGLLSATLLMGALVNRYQAHQALVGSRVRRLEAGAAQIAEALSVLRGVPLSRELRLALRGEVLARYQKIRRLYRRYPAILERIRAAETAMHAEGAKGPGGVGPIADEPALRRTLRALDLLLGVMETGGALQPLPADVRGIFRRELGERRAEVLSRFHLVESRRLENAGNLMRARTQLTRLLQVLRQRGPATDFVRELYAEAESAMSMLGAHQADAAVEAQPRGDSGRLLQRRLAG